MKKRLNLIKFFAVLFALVLGLFPFSTVSAAGEAIVTVSVPANVNPGEQFMVNIAVQPGTIPVAGVQFDLAFNPSLVTVDGVAQGNLLTQGGASTYFVSGTINNIAGTVTGVAGAITDPGQSVSTPGTFAVITLTAGTQTGTASLSLSNIIAGNTEGQAVTVIVNNGQVSIGQSSGGEEDGGDEDEGGTDDGGGDTGGGIGGGGGGGGGGASSSGGGGGISGTTSLRNSISASGALMEDISASDIDMKLEVRIARGTVVLNRNGQPPSSIRITPKVENTNVIPDTQIISQSYEIEPSGTTFNPGATLIYKYSNSEIPEGISPENLFLALWDENQAQWTALESVVDTAARTVSVPIEHLSTYALFAYSRPADFQFSNLTASAIQVDPGQSIALSIQVTNTGDAAGDCDVVLKLDGETAQTLTLTLGSGVSRTATFNVTPSMAGEHTASVGSLSTRFTVGRVSTPANFTTSNLSIYPQEIRLGNTVSIGVLVSNTGDLTGTYHAVLRVANTETASSDIELDGGASKNVSFTITPEAIGNYTVTLGGLQAAFTVMAPAPAVEVVPELAISGFQATPEYNPSTDRIVSTRIDYQLDGTPEQITGCRLVLKASHEGEYLEEVALFSPEMPLEGNAGSYSYIPSSGWKEGEYRFQVVLYRGEIFLQSSELKGFTATPEAVAAIFSWNIMAIVIVSAMIVAAIVVVLTVLRRRDMLHN
jgi:hypothetical protein